MNEEHVKILRSGVSGVVEWNAWRVENPDIVPDLSKAHFARAHFARANFTGADFMGANFTGADFMGANFTGANFERANFTGANFERANFAGANFERANFTGADFMGANFARANFERANFERARLPSPAMVLSAEWGVLSEGTTLALMRLDASGHPDPSAFDRWAAGGPCPYDDVCVQRIANFKERRDLWSPGPAPRIYDAMAMVLDEKCPGWRGTNA